MLAWLLAQQIIVLFMIVGCGFLLVKAKLLPVEASKSFSIAIIYLINPCTIVNAFQIEYKDSIRDGFLLAIGAAIIIHVMLFIICGLCSRVLKFDVVERASLIYSNAGNLIIPLVIAVLGEKWVIYASAFLCVQNILIWTHCNSLMEGRVEINWKKIIYNINLLSIGFGMICFFLGLKLPPLTGQAVKTLASMIGPVSMLILGMLLGAVKWQDIFTNKRIYLITFCKMIVFPAIICCFLKYSGLASLVPDGKTILLVSLLAATAPSASMVTQLAQIYNRNSQYASAINVLTTLCCVVTMPLMVVLYML